MMRVLLHVFIAFFLSVFETSLISSLPDPWRFMPFVLVISVYLLQHHSIRPAAWWMVAHGIFLDLSGIATIPLVTFSYILAAAVALMSAETLFSNRSFYGVIACTLLTDIVFLSTNFLLRLGQSIFTKTPMHFLLFVSDLWSQAFMLFVFSVILFSFAKQIRFALVKLSLIPESRRTF